MRREGDRAPPDDYRRSGEKVRDRPVQPESRMPLKPSYAERAHYSIGVWRGCVAPSS